MPANSKRKLLSLSERFTAINTSTLGTVDQPETSEPELAGSPGNNNTKRPHGYEEPTTVTIDSNIKPVKQNLKVSLKVNRQNSNETKHSKHSGGLNQQPTEIDPHVLSFEQKYCSLQETKSSTTAVASTSLRHSSSQIYKPSISVSEIDNLHGTKSKISILHNTISDESEPLSAKNINGTCELPSIVAVSTNASVICSDTSNSIIDQKIPPNADNNHQDLRSSRHLATGNTCGKEVPCQAGNLESCSSRHFTKLAGPPIAVADKSAFLSETGKHTSHVSYDQIHENKVQCLEIDMPNVQTNDNQSCSGTGRFDKKWLDEINTSSIDCAKCVGELSSSVQIIEVPSSYNAKTKTVVCNTKIDKRSVCLDNVSCSESVRGATDVCDVSFQENFKHLIQSSVKTTERKRRHSENQAHNPSFPTFQPYGASKIDNGSTSGTLSELKHKKPYRSMFNTEYSHKSNQSCKQNLEFLEHREPNQTTQVICDFPSNRSSCVENIFTSSSMMNYSKPCSTDQFYNPRIALCNKNFLPQNDINLESVKQMQFQNVPRALSSLANSGLTLSQHCNIQTSPDIGKHSMSNTCDAVLSSIHEQNVYPKVPQFENLKTNPSVPNPYLARFYKSNSEFSAPLVANMKSNTDCHNSLSHVIGTLTRNPVTDEKFKTFETESTFSKVAQQSDNVDHESAQLVTTLLEQCKALVQTDEDKDALSAVVTMIKHEADPDGTRLDTLEVIDMECSYESASEAGNEKRAMVPWQQLSPVLHSSKKTSSDIYHIKDLKFEGRTLLKGGVEPRHIPCHLKRKPDKSDPVDPRTQTYDDLYKYSVELPLPMWACEVIGAEKVKTMESGHYNWDMNTCDCAVEKRATENQKAKNTKRMSENVLQNNYRSDRDGMETENKCGSSSVLSENKSARDVIETSNIVNSNETTIVYSDNGSSMNDQTVLKSDISNMPEVALGDDHNQTAEIADQPEPLCKDLYQTPAKISNSPNVVLEENDQQTQVETSNTPELYLMEESYPDLEQSDEHVSDGEMINMNDVGFHNEFRTPDLCDKNTDMIHSPKLNFGSVSVEQSVTALLKHVRNSLKGKETESDRFISNILEKHFEGKEKILETSREPINSSPLDDAEHCGIVGSESSDQIGRTISNTEVPVITCFYEQPLVRSADIQSPNINAVSSPNNHCGKENKNNRLKMLTKSEKFYSANCHKLNSAIISIPKKKLVSPRKCNRNLIWKVHKFSRTMDSRSKEHTWTSKECAGDPPNLSDEPVIISDSDRLQKSCRINLDQHPSRHRVESRKSKNNSQYAPRDATRERQTRHDRSHESLAICDKLKKKTMQRDGSRERHTQHCQSRERCTQRDKSRDRPTRDMSRDKRVQQNVSRGRHAQYEKLEKIKQHDGSQIRSTQHNRSCRTPVDRSSHSNINRHADIQSESKSERNRACLLFENGVLVTDDHSSEQSYDNCVPSIIDTLSITQDPISDQQDRSVTRSDFVEDNYNRRSGNEFSDYHSVGGSDSHSMWLECEGSRSENHDYENKSVSSLEREESTGNVLPSKISDEFSDHHTVDSMEEQVKWSDSEIMHSEKNNFMKTKLLLQNNNGCEMELDNVVELESVTASGFKKNVFREVQEKSVFERLGTMEKNGDFWRERKHLASNSSRQQNNFCDGKRKKPF